MATELVEGLYEVEIPSGYVRVTRGRLQTGDRHVNAYLLTKGETEWMPVPSECVNQSVREFYCGAQWYACLIRNINEKPLAAIRAAGKGRTG